MAGAQVHNLLLSQQISRELDLKGTDKAQTSAVIGVLILQAVA